MTMVSPKAALGIAAGIFGTLFVGYCVYFDRQRRSDPNFKKKLLERRKAKKLNTSAKNKIVYPDFRDHEAVQTFFLRQVQLGEELLGQGDIDKGIDHLCRAVAICGQPSQILEILQQTLPPNLFLMLIQRLPDYHEGVQLNIVPGMMVEEEVE